MSHQSQPTCVGLIPARAGSKRVPGKNVRVLAGHPLIAYSIAAAIESGVFARVLVSTDSSEIADIARHYGADVPFLRPSEMAQDLSPDIEWIEHVLDRLADEGCDYEAFAILRPTNPFRSADTIRRAWRLFAGQAGIDSLRAVEKCSEHPGKMWVLRGTERPRMVPLLPFGPAAQPWHSSAYQSLPEVYVQNASLEMAWARVVREGRTIAGETVVPFVSQGLEGYDINRPYDLRLAEEMITNGEAVLPSIPKVPYEGPRVPPNRTVGEAA